MGYCMCATLHLWKQGQHCLLAARRMLSQQVDFGFLVAGPVWSTYGLSARASAAGRAGQNVHAWRQVPEVL